MYAHLDHFTPELDNLISALHQHYGKYTIDHKLGKNEYFVEKGDIIGWITHNRNWSFTTMARVCDFKHQVKGANEAGRGYEFCYYIGYIREER